MNLIFCGDSFPVVEHPGGGQTEVGSEEVNVDGVTGVQDLGISRQKYSLVLPGSCGIIVGNW